MRFICYKPKWTILFTLIIGVLLSSAVDARESFTLGDVTIEPGTKKSFTLKAPGRGLPVTVIQGVQPGPVLTITAGVHGDEFPPIFAVQELRKSIKPESLNGTLVLLHLANLPGFHARLIALHPEDGKNLNREFPGHTKGTPTEQLAHYLTTKIIPKTDYLIDLHSGSAYQALLPHVYSPVIYNDELDKTTLAFAKSTGLKHIVLYDERPNDLENSISYPNTAQIRGKPALTVEIGHLGLRDQSFVDDTVTVCRNALIHLGMIKGTKINTQDAILYQRLKSAKSTVDGIFTPLTKVGKKVKKGDVLGFTTDYFGEQIEEVTAPVNGTVLMLLQTPAVSKGQSPATLAVDG